MISFHFETDVNAAVFEVVGEFSVANYLEVMERFMHSDGFYPGIDAIWDVRQAVTDALTAEDIQSIAEHTRKIAATRGPKWKVAIIVGTDADYGMSRMYQAYAGSTPTEVMVFRSMSDARTWISAD
ncbi:hypothetical protein ACFL0O_03890 [Thermodesulfobacteriota bacterium]